MLGAQQFVRTGILVGLVILYLFIGSTSVEKFLAKKTIVISSVADFDKVEFPAITFCKLYTFKDPCMGIIRQIDKWDNVSAEALKKWAIENTQTRDQIFHFIQHRSESRKFPCDTVNSHTYTGPCSFPFKIYDCALADPNYPERSGLCDSFDAKEMQTLNSCTLTDDIKPWCAVHVYDNKSSVIGGWGYCDETCNGELPNQQAPEYIASSAFDSLWNRRIFHFKPWDAGHCHTYSPNETYLPNHPGHFYGFLGDNTLNQSVDEVYGYHVYLHSSKHFWASDVLSETGQAKQILLNRGEYIKVEFEREIETRLPAVFNCIDDKEYSFTDCVFEYIFEKTGCKLDWFSEASVNVPLCDSAEEIKKLYDLMDNISKWTFKTISESSGCYSPCVKETIIIKSIKREKINWAVNWTSEFFLESYSDRVKVNEENLVYDAWELLNGLGGLLGLILGYSILSLCDYLIICVISFFRQHLFRDQNPAV